MSCVTSVDLERLATRYRMVRLLIFDFDFEQYHFCSSITLEILAKAYNFCTNKRYHYWLRKRIISESVTDVSPSSFRWSVWICVWCQLFWGDTWVEWICTGQLELAWVRDGCLHCHVPGQQGYAASLVSKINYKYIGTLIVLFVHTCWYIGMHASKRKINVELPTHVYSYWEHTCTHATREYVAMINTIAENVITSLQVVPEEVWWLPEEQKGFHSVSVVDQINEHLIAMV